MVKYLLNKKKILNIAILLICFISLFYYLTNYYHSPRKNYTEKMEEYPTKDI